MPAARYSEYLGYAPVVRAAMICQCSSAARWETDSGGIPPSGWGIPKGWNPLRPKTLACLNAEFKNGSVQMTIVGIPLFSRAMASCTLHAVQDPQSAMQVTTKSHCEARSSMISSAAGRE